MNRPTAFWDTSALIPLCIGQPKTRRCIELYKLFDIAVWWAASVEIASGLARLLRMQQIDSANYAKATSLATRVSQEWRAIHPNEQLRISAVQLVQRYDLKAADALQLAAALEWCGNQPQGKIFLTSDAKLKVAASACGFDTSKL